MFFLILGVIVWFVCGWWAGAIYRKSNLKAHLGWGREEEIRQRFLIVGGPFTLFGFSTVVLIDGSKCGSLHPAVCQEYLLRQKKIRSWFGKYSDYDKILHPEYSINL